MRRPLLFALVVTFTLAFNASSAATAPSLLAGQRVLVLGDSITQNGRYVTFLEYYLHRLAPGARCDLISIGLGSETISGLTEPNHAYPRPNGLDRLDRALSTVKPTVVFACYGMNDGIYHPSSPERLAAFTSGLDVLITKVRAAGAKLVLITPPIFDPLPIPKRIAPADTTVYGYQKTFAVTTTCWPNSAPLSARAARPTSPSSISTPRCAPRSRNAARPTPPSPSRPMVSIPKISVTF